MTNSILLIIFILTFIFTFTPILKLDIFFGLLYLFYFVYSIFAVIGYLYLPQLSIQINAYFGEEIIQDALIFLILSFLSYFLFIRIFGPWAIKANKYPVFVSSEKKLFFLFLFLLHTAYQATYFILYANEISYSNASNEIFITDMGTMYFIFGYQFKLMVPLNLVLYIRNRLFTSSTTSKTFNNSSTKLYRIIWVVHLGIFLTIASKIGSRTDPVALSLGIIVFELFYNNWKNKYISKLLKTGVICAVLFFTISILPSTRELVILDDSIPTIERIILQDYFAPAHILFAAIAHHYIEPLEVLTSNLYNSLILFKYPYLQMTIGDLFAPGASSRSSSYAFFAFSEGYLFMGMWGFIYNGVVFSMGSILFRVLASSNNRYLNSFAIGLVSTQIVNLARSQSCYFIKDFYLFFIIGFFIFYLATGLRPQIFRHNN